MRDRIMTDQWMHLRDEELAEIAQRGLQGQGAPVEAMRRLRLAIENTGKKGDIYSRRMLWLTIILAVNRRSNLALTRFW